MRTCIAIVEKCPETGLYVGCVPGCPDLDIQAETLDELYHDLHEVIDMILGDSYYTVQRKLMSAQNVIVA